MRFLIYIGVVVAAATLSGAAHDRRESPTRITVESYRDIILKARNLVLQRDRLQASQLLKQALSRETRSSVAYRELHRTLDELTSFFLTEEGQNHFSVAESLFTSKPAEAISSYQAALRSEEGNTAVLTALARLHLILGDCRQAELSSKKAQEVNPLSVDVRLLQAQVAHCLGQTARVHELLSATDTDWTPIETYMRGLQMQNLMQRDEVKKARALLISWERTHPNYPEVYYWKWKLSLGKTSFDRAAALQYISLCQKLTPRQKKKYRLDLGLCLGREKAEAGLKIGEVENGPQ